MIYQNYYIVIPITPVNIAGVYTFINANSENLCNIGGNCETLQVVANPLNPLEASFRFELSEEFYPTYEVELAALGAVVYTSAPAYLTAYPGAIIEAEEQ